MTQDSGHELPGLLEALSAYGAVASEMLSGSHNPQTASLYPPADSYEAKVFSSRETPSQIQRVATVREISGSQPRRNSMEQVNTIDQAETRLIQRLRERVGAPPRLNGSQPDDNDLDDSDLLTVVRLYNVLESGSYLCEATDDVMTLDDLWEHGYVRISIPEWVERLIGDYEDERC